MKSAAIPILLFASLVFGWLSGSAGAGVQLDPVDTLSSAVSTAASPTGQASDLTNSVGDAADGVTGTVNNAAENVAGTVNDATGSVTGGTSSGGGGGSGSSPLDSVTGSITGALSGSSGSGAGATSSGGGSGSSPNSGRSSSSSGDTASNRGSRRTRFDRLPRQYERLLERIESGVDVRASSARLRALLATASPSLRTQISRLIRQEIRRLRKGGLTHQERAALRRLTPLLKALEASRPPAGISPPSDTASPPATSSERPAQIAGIRDASLRSERPVASGSGGSELTPLFPFPLPSPPGPIYWLPVLLAAIAGCLWLAARAPRNVLPSGVRGFVEVRGAELSGLAALIAIIGAAWAVLIQLLLL
jgi:hypothetical protein